MWDAIEKGRRPFQCKDLGDSPQSDKFKRLLGYAEQYNNRLLELDKVAK
jgi:hypothetical protein